MCVFTHLANFYARGFCFLIRELCFEMMLVKSEFKEEEF